MEKPLVDRIPFPKIVTVLAVAFGVGLGLCGLSAALTIGGAQRNSFLVSILMSAGVLELIVIAVSGVGLVATTIAWVVLSVVGSFSRGDSEPQRLFDDEEDTKHDDRQ